MEVFVILRFDIVRSMKKTNIKNAVRNAIDEDEHELVIEEQAFHVKSKKKTAFKPLSVAEKIRSKIKIDPNRPTYDLLIFWKAMNWKFEEIEKKEVVKWQPEKKFAEDWDNIELQLVNADIRQGESKSKVFCPKSPWSYSREFFDHYDITEEELDLISRIELVAVDGACSLIVADQDSYIGSKIQVRWIRTGRTDNILTDDGKECQDDLERKVDLSKSGPASGSDIDERFKSNLKYIDSRTFLLKNSVFSDEDCTSFSTDGLRRAYDQEFPLIEILEFDRISKQEERRNSLEF